jgi:outer membrane immunogenic protein
MKKFLLTGVAVAALACSPALAADLPARMPVKAPPVQAPIAYNWSGFYIGGHGGGGFSDKSFTSDGLDDGSHDGDGWVAGGQVGFNWQTGQFVFGIEFSGSAADISGSHPSLLTDPSGTYSSDINSIFLLTGRVGLAFDRLLLYVNGGGAWVREEIGFVSDDFGSDSVKKNRNGWTVGGGLEYGITPNWSIAAQYNFIDLGDKNTFFVNNGFNASSDQQIHLVTGRLNYRFNWGGPVVARY